jgi:hypothetical protein
LPSSDDRRLSVTRVDVSKGHEAEFHAISTQFGAILAQKEYGRAVVVADEAEPLRFYSVHHWNGVASAELCHGDPEIQALTARLYQIARVTHVVNGVRRPEMMKLLLEDRRARVESDRRAGFDRRTKDVGRSDGDRRKSTDRRLGPRRLRDRPGEVDLIAAARRAREHADAKFSNFQGRRRARDRRRRSDHRLQHRKRDLRPDDLRRAGRDIQGDLGRAPRVSAHRRRRRHRSADAAACGMAILWEFGGNLRSCWPA